MVAEVLAVDDASSDGTASVLDELAALQPRVKVLHRAENSGGCGTPRNDGTRAATARTSCSSTATTSCRPGRPTPW
ncbi:glycosyltransferase family 2 protein [Streptomyces cirratus]